MILFVAIILYYFTEQ